MQRAGFTYWREGEHWLGYLEDFPDYVTQGISFEDLQDHLVDLHRDLASDTVPGVRRHAELEVP